VEQLISVAKECEVLCQENQKTSGSDYPNTPKSKSLTKCQKSFSREGFKELVSQVTARQVGIILSYDVTRLSRNCSDWYPLLDLCGYTNGAKSAGKARSAGFASPLTFFILDKSNQVQSDEEIAARLTASLNNVGCDITAMTVHAA